MGNAWLYGYRRENPWKKDITRRIARPQERSLDNYRDEAAKEL